MRRVARAGRSGGRTGDIRQDLSHDQLAALGAVLLSFSEAEWIIDQLLYDALRLHPAIWRDVATRINGVEKVSLIKLAAEQVVGFGGEELQLIRQTLGDYGAHRKYRDSLAHAHIFDAASGIGDVTNKRDAIYEVLLTAEALEILYQHVTALRRELDIVANALSLQFHNKVRPDVTAWYAQQYAGNPSLPPPGRDLADCLSSLRAAQEERRRLSPLPEIPDNPRGT
jgi:hypothetical protein